MVMSLGSGEPLLAQMAYLVSFLYLRELTTNYPVDDARVRTLAARLDRLQQPIAGEFKGH